VPTLAETLGKVQSNAENNAVEELIKKLKGNTGYAGVPDARSFCPRAGWA